MLRSLYLLYGVVCYLIFFGTFVYLLGFAWGMVVPKGINDGPETALIPALLVNLGFIALFAIQHTIMARPAFKKVWEKIVPKPIERSTFVLVTSVILILMYWQWRPLPETIYDLRGNNAALYGLLGVSMLGYVLVLISTFLIDHFDLFGLRQVWINFRGHEYTDVPFVMPAVYRWVRNPMMLGFVLFMWATPHMTQGHLIFALGFTIYILIGVRFEERDIAAALGEEYVAFREKTPLLIPRPPRD